MRKFSVFRGTGTRFFSSSAWIGGFFVLTPASDALVLHYGAEVGGGAKQNENTPPKYAIIRLLGQFT
jgi:hypothetical protein